MRTPLSVLAAAASVLLATLSSPPPSPPRPAPAPSFSPPPQTFRLRIHGWLDRTHRIAIAPAGARWNSRDTPPREVDLGERTWRPGRQPFLPNAGETAFLPADVVFASARLCVHKSRDLLGLEIDDDVATVFACDTPEGEGEYDFDLVFDRRERHARPVELTIRARIDGSDELRIEAGRLCWRHRYWQAPEAVRIGGEPWNVAAAPERSCELLPAGVDFRTARVVARKGRDTVCLRIAADHVLVLFADDPPGADDYVITLQFGTLQFGHARRTAHRRQAPR